MLKVEKLNVHFGDFHALKDVSLEIPDGEFFTLLGPSGRSEERRVGKEC